MNNIFPAKPTRVLECIPTNDWVTVISILKFQEFLFMEMILLSDVSRSPHDDTCIVISSINRFIVLKL